MTDVNELKKNSGDLSFLRYMWKHYLVLKRNDEGHYHLIGQSAFICTDYM